MTQIRRQIDRIIIRLKQQAALQNVRFVREYGSEPVETPIYGMLAAVGIVKTARDTGFIGGLLNTSLRGESYSAEVEIRVYAPQGENGSESDQDQICRSSRRLCAGERQRIRTVSQLGRLSAAGQSRTIPNFFDRYRADGSCRKRCNFRNSYFEKTDRYCFGKR